MQFPKRFSAICCIGFLLAASAGAQDVSAFWEHGPISEHTRLPKDRPATWSSALLYNDTGLFPGDLFCPGNVSLDLTVFNVSTHKIYVRRPETPGQVILRPGQMATIPFGKVPTGDHVFFIDAAPNQIQDNQDDPDYIEIPARMKCYIHATCWPGDHTPYRASLILQKHRTIPANLWLPAGKRVELFCAGTEESRILPLGNHELRFIPSEVTLTEIPATAPASSPPPAAKPPAAIRFR